MINLGSASTASNGWFGDRMRACFDSGRKEQSPRSCSYKFSALYHMELQGCRSYGSRSAVICERWHRYVTIQRRSKLCLWSLRFKACRSSVLTDVYCAALAHTASLVSLTASPRLSSQLSYATLLLGTVELCCGGWRSRRLTQLLRSKLDDPGKAERAPLRYSGGGALALLR